MKTLSMDNFISVDKITKILTIEVDSDDKGIIEDAHSSNSNCVLGSADTKECSMTFALCLEGPDKLMYRPHLGF